MVDDVPGLITQVTTIPSRRRVWPDVEIWRSPLVWRLIVLPVVVGYILTEVTFIDLHGSRSAACSSQNECRTLSQVIKIEL